MIVGYCILNGKKWVMFEDKQCAAGEVKLTDGFKDKLIRWNSDKLIGMESISKEEIDLGKSREAHERSQTLASSSAGFEKGAGRMNEIKITPEEIGKAAELIRKVAEGTTQPAEPTYQLGNRKNFPEYAHENF